MSEDKITQLIVELEKIEKVIKEFMNAVATTVSQGNYDEALIRKAVSFELAEIIVGMRKEHEKDIT